MSDSDQTKIAVLQNQMNNVEKKVDEGFAAAKYEIAQLNEKMDAFIEAADAKYAPKVAWDAIRWAIVATVGLVLAAVIAQVIK